MANPTSSADEIRGDLFTVDSKNGIRINGWVISSQRKPIASEADRARLVVLVCHLRLLLAECNLLCVESWLPLDSTICQVISAPYLRHMCFERCWGLLCSDMTYGDNVVTLQHEGSGFNASFCASDAIARCAKEANSSVDSIQVVAAQHWAQRHVAT